MSCLKPEIEIEKKRRQIGVEIELILINAILKSLEIINTNDIDIFDKHNDPDYIPF
jgi:hypothetical protein